MPLSQPLRKNSHILWTISLIQDVHPEAQTKIEFAEMTNDVIASQSVESVTLCLAEGLQRFRLMVLHGISEDEATKRCEEMTAGWYEDNSNTLKELEAAKKVSTLTWKEFLAWPKYEETIKSIQAWYENNRDFRHDVDGRIRQELENVRTTAKLSDVNEQTQLFKRYIFEECAFQKFSAIKRFDYELYKTPMSKAMRRIKHNSDFVPPGMMTEIYFTQFSPNRRKSSRNSSPTSAISAAQNSRATDVNFSSVLSTKNSSFGSVFSVPTNNHTSIYSAPADVSNITKQPMVSVSVLKPPIMKTAEFIEKALALIPAEMQAEAIEKLIKFTTQEIIPLSYSQKTLKT